MASPPWDDEATEHLKRLHAERRWTCSEMARAIGRVTRNAVIGKLHRLGLVNMDERVAAAKGKKARRPAGALVRAPSVPGPPRQPRPPSLPPEPAPPLSRTLVSLLNVRYGQCRFPFGEGAGLMFCGAPVIVGRSWCPHHYAICTAGTAKWTKGF